ncbi:MAG: hypothetical protein ABFD20_05560 [Anaerolineales bacterium]
MHISTTRIGALEISRLLIGGNPFSGFSHQSMQRDAEMRAWYTDERIIETLFAAEALGLQTCLMRGDEHITRVLAEFWRRGGKLRWVAQTDSSAPTPAEGARYCHEHGAAACYLHGGVVDHLLAHQQYEPLYAFQEAVQGAGLPAGIAGHLPADFAWAEEHLALDFYMVSYYNPSPRDLAPQHDPAAAERYTVEDREERVAIIPSLRRPAIHYKILAAGRTPAAEAFAYAAAHLRPQDAVCVGVHTADKPDMLAEDVALFWEYTAQR